MNRALKVAVAFTVLVGLPAVAAEFEVRITSWPPELPEGAPVAVTYEARNVSGHPLTVARGAGGFALSAKARRVDGSAQEGCPPMIVYQYSRWYKPEILPPGWHEVIANTLCNDNPGELVVQAILASYKPKGGYPLAARVPTVFEAWSGEVRSQEVHIRIVEPTGIDLEAYAYFKGQPFAPANWTKLVDEFPTSTYAGFALMHMGRLDSWPELALAQRDGLRAEKARGKPLDSSGERYEEELRKSAEAWLRLIPPFLSAHPDFYLASVLRLELVGAFTFFDRYVEAKEQCDLVNKQAPSSEEAKKAVAFVSLLREKHYLAKE